MVLEPGVIERWEEVRDDPRTFVRRLTIQDYHNKKREIESFLFEQVPWIDALCDPHRHRVLGIKPRQVGWTTATMAYFFWKLYTSSRGRSLLQVVHEDTAVKRLHRMVQVLHTSMPWELSAPLAVDNRWRTEFSHNMAAIQRVLAGGSGQGRSDTYTDLHATEMSKWKQGTAAVANQDGLSADEEMFGSAISTMHDPTGSIVVESTGSGPQGLFHKLFEQGTQGEDSGNWNIVFVSWLDVPRYQLEITEHAAIELSRDLDDIEREIVRGHGASMQQIAWRRDRLRTLQMTALMFSREFPTVPTDPFRMSEAGWYSATALDRMLTRYVPARKATADDELVVWHPFEEGSRYYLGVDCAGGTGGDEACIQVFRDDGAHVACWASRWASPRKQGHMVSRIGGLYSSPSSDYRPKANIERNKHGAQVIAVVRELGGVDLWVDEDGDTWWTDDLSKLALLTHARELVQEGWVAFREFATVRQFQVTVEKSNGRIEAKGKANDDRMMAAALGLWAGKREWKRDSMGTDALWESLRQKRIQERFATVQGALR